MISELTPEQVQQMPVFVEKYVKAGLNTDRIDRENAKKFVTKLYKLLGRDETDPVCIVMGGPTDAWIAVYMLEQLSSPETGETKPLPQEVFDRVSKQVLDQSGVKLENKVSAGIKELVWPYLDGHCWAPYIAWIKFYESIGVKITVDYSVIEDSLEFGNIYPLTKYCVISEKPLEINRNSSGLHNATAPALLYADKTRIWALNGVVVPDWLVLTKWDKLDCHEFAKIQNAEVRREFIRKVGVERLCTELKSEVLDKQGDYELHLIDLGGTTGNWPYLKMKNPSIGVWHMEAVAKTCKTVDAALTWRNGTEERPEVLT